MNTHTRTHLESAVSAFRSSVLDLNRCVPEQAIWPVSWCQSAASSLLHHPHPPLPRCATLSSLKDLFIHPQYAVVPLNCQLLSAL